MNKSVSISLGGLSFFIEEDAFQKLQKYLKDVELSLNTEEEDTAEILKDVETRIAELFKEWLGNYRQVVDSKDVDKVIGIMGTPEQYQSEGGEEEKVENYTSGAKDKEGKFYQRQLFRDMDDKMIAGVCSGVAHFFGIQPIWFRLGTVLLFILSGWVLDGLASTIFFVYIILWIVMPKASTTSDKLKMKGKPVNFDSIKEYVNKEEISEQTGKIKKNISKASNGIGDFLETFFKVLIKILVIFAGIIFIIIGFSLLISYFIGAFSFSLDSANSLQFMDLIFDSSWQFYLLLALAGIIVIVPSLLLILIGLRLLTEKKVIRTSVTAIISIFVIWLIAIIAAAILCVSQIASQFGNSVEKVNKQLIQTNTDTLTIVMNDYENKSDVFHKRKFSINNIDGIIFTKEKIVKKIDKDLEVKQSADSNFYLVVKNSATGKSESVARKNLAGIEYKYRIDGNILNLDSYLSIPKNSKFRNQDVELVLYVPKDKFVKTDNVDEIKHEENGNINIYYNNDENLNKVFKFAGNSLKCVTCTESDNIFIGDSGESVNIDKDGIRIKSAKDKVNININKRGIKINNHGTDSL